MAHKKVFLPRKKEFLIPLKLVLNKAFELKVY